MVASVSSCEEIEDLTCHALGIFEVQEVAQVFELLAFELGGEVAFLTCTGFEADAAITRSMQVQERHIDAWQGRERP